MLEDNFFPTRTILMFLGALERGDQGLSITSKKFEIGSLSFENEQMKKNEDFRDLFFWKIKNTSTT